MKKFINFIRSNKNINIFILTLFVIGIIFGIIYFLNLDNETSNSITTELINFKELLLKNNQNAVFNHLIIIICIFILSFSVIGIVLIMFNIFYQGLCFGFLITSFTSNFGLSGLLFSLIFYLLCILFFIITIYYLTIIAYQITRNIIDNIRGKKQSNFIKLFKREAIIFLILIISNVIYDIFIYYFGNKILSILNFLI